MAGHTEQHLSETLIDPENLDDPAGQWTRGEKQESKCRDAWAALLFYAQFGAIVGVAGALGGPAMGRVLDDDGDESSSTESTPEYTGLIYASLIAGGFSLILSSISLAVMSACPKLLIQISLLFSLVVSAVSAVAAFFFGGWVVGAFGVVLFLLSCCYTYAVWSRIPFAAANLHTGLTAVKGNAGVVAVAYLIIMVSYLYAMVWMVALVGVYDKVGQNTDNTENVNDSTNPDDTSGNDANINAISGGYTFLLLLALFWTQQVFQNTIHTIVAGVVSTWWFHPEDAGSFCSVAIKDSFVRATTTSFGSICFGSLLVAIIQTLKAMVQSARSDNDMGGCGAFLLCLVECLLRCLEDALEYFNKFAYIYVGMYGYTYLEAGKNVINLFTQKGWTIIIADNLISNVLSLFCLVIGGITACMGLVLNNINPSWFEVAGDSDVASNGLAAGFSFLIGVVLSAITLSVVDSSVNTVLVCFAEGPSEFERNHPELSSEMRDAWREVYPAECGF